LVFICGKFVYKGLLVDFTRLLFYLVLRTFFEKLRRICFIKFP